MTEILLLFIWLLFFTMIVVATYKVHHLLKQYAAEDSDEKVEGLQTIQTWLYTLIVLASIGSVLILYMFLKGTFYESHFLEWLNLTVRLIHITFGIAWIGASFYFVFLENALNRTKDVRDELAGNLWAVHGGGFYHVEKYKLAPKESEK